MNHAKGTTMAFTRPDGSKVEGYLARPEHGEKAPAVVVIQEWWGLNDQIRGVADRLARCGYQALVPDLYRGKSTVEEEEAHHLMDGLDFADAVAQDIRGAVDELKKSTDKVAVMGFCMGGALSVLSVCNLPDLAAGVIYYGAPPLEYVDPSNVKFPVLGHFGTQDAFFPIDGIDQLEKKMRDAGVDVQFHRYLAHHAFANETAVGEGRIAGTQYDPDWARMAWDRTLTFFGRTLWS
jgi:carboxymethylenebutenolidase